MPHWPLTLSALFIAITIATLLLIVLAIPKAQKRVIIRVLGISVLWLVLQTLLSKSVYSSHLETLPPRIVVFGMLPAFLIIGIAFLLLPAGALQTSYQSPGSSSFMLLEYRWK